MKTYLVEVYTNGSIKWKHPETKKLHRKDGPAVEYADGDKEWYIHDNLHREDGPAIEYTNGDREWYIHGNPHREDGPAIEYTNGDREWYLNGEKLTEEEFLKRTTKHKELSIRELEEILGYPVKIIKE